VIDRSALTQEAYRNNPGSLVAFVDESYLTPDFAVEAKATPFYLMTAYVIPVAELQHIREDIVELAGRRFWHSTQAHQTQPGREKLKEFATYVGDGDEPMIVSVQYGIGAKKSGTHEAREACFARLLQALSSGEFF